MAGRLDHGTTPAIPGEGLDPATLRYGDRVVVDGREAVVVYSREPGIVIRYQGEHQTRGVSLRMLRRSEAR
jgi:hypothetical protein